MTLRSIIVSQFKQPRGLLGHLAGVIMATRPSNRLRNQWTVELMDIQPNHRILEIGCGPGLALKACATRAAAGHSVGIDHSELMVARARRLLSPEIAANRATVRLGNLSTVANLPATFDRVYSLNVVQFFPDMDEAFQLIHDRLAPGGMATTTYQPRCANPSAEDALKMAERIADAMRSAGFSHIERHELQLDPAPVISVTGLESRHCVNVRGAA